MNEITDDQVEAFLNYQTDFYGCCDDLDSELESVFELEMEVLQDTRIQLMGLCNNLKRYATPGMSLRETVIAYLRAHPEEKIA